MSERIKKYNFQKLTPEESVDLGLYQDVFEYIMTTPSIHNVAISGPYGAGKSSLINSYKKKKENKSNFIHISLAHFNMLSKSKREISESDLEGKIINQLIHQIPPNKISQTNFKIKNKVSEFNVISSTTLIMAFIISILHIVFFNSWNVFVTSLSSTWIQLVFSYSITKYSILFSGIVSLTIFYRFLYLIVKAQKSKNVFRKLRLQGNEIEIFEENDESLFDKYLNEVLYLFENVEADVIVFEDIDRFEANGIFARLHEINTLINIKRTNNNQKTLRFFYLLSDDIFTSKDRTKFFDYILPVIPVIDSSNSHNKLINLFKSGGIYKLFDEDFLYGLSLYVDDMRILKNVYNEFQIYYNQLNTTELNPNKMLAIITYKNLFPRDFSQLQLNQGMVYALFSEKNKFIESEVLKLENLILNKNQEIQAVNKEHLESIEELELVYRDKKSKVHQKATTYQSQQQMKQDYDKQLILRKDAIKTKESNSIAVLENDLLTLKEELTSISNKRLSEIISRENIDEIFKISTINNIGEESTFYEIKGSEYFTLLKYLIRNGYIDESYSDYITYFYEDSLSKTDKTFLRSLTDKKAKKFSYKLENPMTICKKLKITDFSQEEILNFDLVDFILKTRSNLFIDQLILQLKNEKNFDFIKEYFENSNEINNFLYHINLKWPQLFGLLLKGKILNEDQIYKYSVLSLNVSSEEVLHLMNEGDVLKEYISNKPDYLKTDNLNIEKAVEAFSILKISFECISEANVTLLKAIYENSLYVINSGNLLLMLNKFYQGESENYKIRNYTEIRQMSESPLSHYIENNINEYIIAMLSIDNSRIEDKEEFLLNILNNEEISLDYKKNYISRLSTIISTLDKVEDKNLWSELLSEKLVNHTVHNIIDFFLMTGTLEEVLIANINEGKQIIDYSSVEKHYGTEVANDLLDKVIKEEKLSDVKYREILVGLNFEYYEFDVQDLSHEKIEILVEEKIIKMNIENLKFIRINYQNILFDFIRVSIDEYVSIMTEELMVYKEVIMILGLNIDDALKIKLLGTTKETFSILMDNYSLELKKFILDNNCNVNDLPTLFDRFDEYEEDIAEKIFVLAISNVDLLLESKGNISNLLSKKILSSEEVDNTIKIKFITSLIPEINIEDFKECVEVIGLEEYQKIFEPYKRPKIEINELNNSLLRALEEKLWIDSYFEDEKRSGYYKVNKI